MIIRNLLAFAVILTLVSGLALAYSSGTVQVTPARHTVSVFVPARAVEVAPHVFDLGTALYNGEEVQGYMIVDKKEAYAKPSGKGKPGSGGTSGSTCYTPMAKGAKWLEAEPYVINPSNADGMDVGFVADSIIAAVDSWDAQTTREVFGPGITTFATLEADTVQPDGVNEVYFAGIEGTGTIAVTIVWGVFGGSPRNRKLVEWDMVFDDDDFRFGNAGMTDEDALGDTSVMDLLAIATHEAGHAAGMDHPDSTCTEETMFAYATQGETKKRTLNAGDIAGIVSLYK